MAQMDFVNTLVSRGIRHLFDKIHCSIILVNLTELDARPLLYNKEYESLIYVIALIGRVDKGFA